MKKIILVSMLFSALLISCKKEKTDSCEVSVAAIAANYKLTKVETVSASASSDVTSTFLDDCKKSAFYRLNVNKTYNYTEISSTCTGSGDGTWDASNNTVSIAGPGGFQFVNAPVESWDCKNLIITQNISLAGTTVKGRFTFVKQ